MLVAIAVLGFWMYVNLPKEVFVPLIHSTLFIGYIYVIAKIGVNSFVDFLNLPLPPSPLFILRYHSFLSLPLPF